MVLEARGAEKALEPTTVKKFSFFIITGKVCGANSVKSKFFPDFPVEPLNFSFPNHFKLSWLFPDFRFYKVYTLALFTGAHSLRWGLRHSSFIAMFYKHPFLRCLTLRIMNASDIILRFDLRVTALNSLVLPKVGLLQSTD